MVSSFFNFCQTFPFKCLQNSKMFTGIIMSILYYWSDFAIVLNALSLNVIIIYILCDKTNCDNYFSVSHLGAFIESTSNVKSLI